MQKSGYASLLALLPIALFSAPAPAPAAEFLSMPVSCALGGDCAIAVYFDADPSADARDYLCGAMTYDGHSGVDFAATTYAAMDRGIPVVAAAPGVVVGMRDGLPDARGPVDPDAVRNRECGNGVLVEHADGLFSQYCHLRQGSVTVLLGDTVDAGTPLGLIGQSGNANFPHVHFELLQNQTPIDPFTGRQADVCGGAGIARWAPETAAALPYFAGLPYHSGFAPEEPDPARIRAGDYDQPTMTAASPELVLWTAVWGEVAGDAVTMTIRGPGGEELATASGTVEETRSWQLHYVRAPRPQQGAWVAGPYSGEISYRRAADGHIWTSTLTVQVTP